MERTLMIIVVLCLSVALLLPTSVQAGGVGVEAEEPWIESSNIERDGRNIVVEFTLVHENGIDSISELEVHFSNWMDGNELRLKNVDDEFVIKENGFNDLKYRTFGEEHKGASNDYMIEVSLSLSNFGYDTFKIEMLDVYGQVMNHNYDIPSPIPGRISYYTYILVGISVYGFIQKKVKGDNNAG